MASLRGDASDTTPIAFAALVLLRVSIAAAGQSWHPPAAEERCPSKWGAQDERGAANHVTPESVAKAAKLIRTGEVIELGRVLSSDMPLSPGRSFNLYTKRTNGPLGSNKRYGNEEVVTTEIGQVGTQLDMFSHLLGGDTAPVEILPNPDKQLDLPVHQIALAVNGIFLLENLKLDQLAAKGV
jgi:hypothetical protein